jgi:hypothetical protein
MSSFSSAPSLFPKKALGAIFSTFLASGEKVSPHFVGRRRNNVKEQTHVCSAPEKQTATVSSFSPGLDHAYGIHSRAVVEWVWDGPVSGHHAIWRNERSYRQGQKPFAIVREC